MSHHKSSVILSIALILCGAVSSATPEKQCVRYVPAQCLFSSDSRQPTAYPRPRHPASFDLQQEAQCPFHESGTFEAAEPSRCGDSFMAVSQRKVPQRHQKEYCASGSLEGDFLRQGEYYHFQPSREHGCSFFDYNRNEVLNFLQGEQMDVVVAGDSMMRQLFVRLVHMMRGARRILDYHIHAPGRYSICAEADHFNMSSINADRGNVHSFKKLDLQFLEETIPELFKYDGMHEAMLGCAEPHVNINYMHAPDFEVQQLFLQRYIDTVAAANKERSVTLVLSVGYWVWTPEVPQDYLDFLDHLAPKVHRIVVLSIPTVHTLAHTGKQGPALLSSYRSRNGIMKSWVDARNTSDIVFVDFDSMSLSRHAPPICVAENWHYQCFLTWPASGNKVVLSDTETNYFRDRFHGAPLVGLYMTEDGQCFDEMNRNVWQLILNLIMK